MRGWGIRLQVLLLALIPTLIISFLLVAYFTSTRLQDLKQTFLERGEAIALKLAPAAEYAVYTRDESALQKLALITLNERDVQGVGFYLANGEELIKNGKLSDSTKFPDKDYLRSSLFMTEEKNSILFTVPIINYSANASHERPAENLLGWIKMELDTQSIHFRQYQILIHTSLILLLGLSISGLHALQMGRNVTRPILELAQAIKKIRQGQLDTRVRTSTYQELQVLENGVNSMAETLENAQNELQKKIYRATASLRRSLETIEVQNLELEISRQEAENASQVKSKFLADMSHEIRTPLNGVIGFINLLKRSELNAVQQNYISIIHKSAKNLLSIINDILDFSKIEAGKLRIEREIMDIRDCVQETLTLFAPYFVEKSLKIIPIIHSNVPHQVLGDPLRIKQVITNLVNNAIKFTDEGSIILRVFLESESLTQAILRILITDTGPGLSQDEQLGLFQAFHQVNMSMDQKLGGSGLGLVICKKLVEQMGGEIGLESEIGKGSTFWFTCEVGKVFQPEISKESEIQAESLTFLSSANILAVDDNEDNLTLIQYLLKELGAKVTTCCSGRAALNLLEETTFDLIFMDIRMPEMNGIEATHAIRALEQRKKRAQTPIVALTAHALISEQEALLAAGIDDYLTKPIDENQLHTLLCKWIQGKTQLKSIDWALAEKIAGDKKDLAKELFEKLKLNIAQDLEKINNAFESKNWQVLYDEVHRLHGASCYCGVPLLTRCLKNLEISLAKNMHSEIINTKIIDLNRSVQELLEVN